MTEHIRAHKIPRIAKKQNSVQMQLDACMILRTIRVPQLYEAWDQIHKFSIPTRYLPSHLSWFPKEADNC